MAMSSTALSLDPEVTIAFAAATREQLLESLRTHSGNLTLDMSAVTDFDSSGVQLLLAARRSLQERGDALVLQAPSVSVSDALLTFGLGETFGIKARAQGTAP